MKKHLALFSSVIVVFSLLLGCSGASGPAKTGSETGTYEAGADVTSESPLDPVYKEYITDTKTGYFVPADNGEHGYLKENHPLVREVSAVVQEFCRDSSNRDYRMDNGKKEYEWYAKDVVEQLLLKKDPEKTLAELKKYQIVQKESGIIVDGIMFTDSGKAAQVAFEETIRWENAAGEYLSKNNISLNTDYKLQGIAILIRETGRWKIQGVNFSKPQPDK